MSDKKLKNSPYLFTLYDIENQLGYNLGINNMPLSIKTKSEITSILDTLNQNISRTTVKEKEEKKKYDNTLFYCNGIPIYKNIKEFESFNEMFNCLITNENISTYVIKNDENFDYIMQHKIVTSQNTYFLKSDVPLLFKGNISNLSKILAKDSNNTSFEIKIDNPNELIIERHGSDISQVLVSNFLIEKLLTPIPDYITTLNSCSEMYLIKFKIEGKLLKTQLNHSLSSTIVFDFNFETKKLLIKSEQSTSTIDLDITQSEIKTYSGKYTIDIPNTFLDTVIKKTTKDITGYLNLGDCESKVLGPPSIIFENISAITKKILTKIVVYHMLIIK